MGKCCDTRCVCSMPHTNTSSTEHSNTHTHSPTNTCSVMYTRRTLRLQISCQRCSNIICIQYSHSEPNSCTCHTDYLFQFGWMLVDDCVFVRLVSPNGLVAFSNQTNWPTFSLLFSRVHYAAYMLAIKRQQRQRLQ